MRIDQTRSEAEVFETAAASHYKFEKMRAILNESFTTVVYMHTPLAA